MSGDSSARERALVVAAWAALALVAFAFAGRELGLPGLYYDEAIHAGPARELLTDVRHGRHLPGYREVELGGRAWPWMTQSYLGAVKSYLLVPSFALFGASLPVLRATTLGMALLGTLFAMLAARRLFGGFAAVATGALLVGDASFLLLSRHDWGPVAPGFLLRCAGLWAVLVWWKCRHARWLVAAGALLGLGLWQKADFAFFLAACGVALAVAVPGAVFTALRSERRALLGGSLAFAASAAPLLVVANGVLLASRMIGNRFHAEGKLAVIGWTLDGSLFLRAMHAGGLRAEFGKLGDAPASLLVPGLALAIAALLVALATGRVPAERRRALVFVLVAFVVCAASLLALPGASEAHHVLNVYPLPHWLLAAGLAVLAGAWRAASPRRGLRHAAALALLVLIAGSGLRITARTLDFVGETGGRGRWTHALDELAADLADDTEAVVVSLDWGFHEPLLFLTDGPELREPFWKSRRPDGRLRIDGDANHLYLVHDTRYRVFRFGSHFLRTARAAAAEGVMLREHRSRDGELAFLSVRIPWPHRIEYDRAFRILPRMAPEPDPEPAAVELDPGAPASLRERR